MDASKKEILAILEYFKFCRSRREVFLEAVEYNALYVAITFDLYRREQRKKRMQQILSSYKGQESIKFKELREKIFLGLINLINNYRDFLGEIYMEIEAGNKQAGQYFTPYSVSKLISRVTFATPPEQNKVITLCEPACGSGGMVVATADTLNEIHFNYTDKLLVVANDVDRNCVYMAYLQISFAAVPAIVKRQDTITQEIYDVFLTPAFTLQASKFWRIYQNLEKKGE